MEGSICLSIHARLAAPDARALGQLFRVSGHDFEGMRRGRLHVTDYGTFRVTTQDWPLSEYKWGLDCRDWFFQRRGAVCGGAEGEAGAGGAVHTTPVRWIHMHGLDPLMLLRLTVKYQVCVCVCVIVCCG